MIGIEIKILREKANKSVRALAKDAAISPGYLSNIENGNRRCTEVVAESLDRVFTTGKYFADLVSQQAFRFPMNSSLRQGSSDVHRRSFMNAALTTGAVSAATLAIPNIAAAAHVADGGSSTANTVSKTHLTAIRSFAQALTAADETSGGGIGGTAVDQFYASDIANLTGASFDNDDVRRDAFALATEVAFLCGWKAHDAGREKAAAEYYDEALELAQESKVAGSDAFVLWAKAVQSTDTVRVNKASVSLGFAKEGAKYARDIGGHTQALMETTVARIHAESGDHKAARKALARVEDQLNTDMKGDAPGIVDIWCPHKANVLNQVGRTVGVLGDWDAAVDHTTAARDLWNRDTHARAWAMDTYLVGNAHYKAGDEATAEAEWRDAIETMQSMNSQRCRDLITSIGERMPHLVDEMAA